MAKRRSKIIKIKKPSTKIKRKISKVTGIPTTKAGRKNKARKIMTCGLVTMSALSLMIGCLIAAIIVF